MNTLAPVLVVLSWFVCVCCIRAPMFTVDLAEAVSTMVWFIHDIDPIQAQYECKPHGTGQSVITVVLIAKLRRKTFQNPPQQSWSGGAANPKLEKRTAHVRLEILHPAKIQTIKK